MALRFSVAKVFGNEASDNCMHMWDQHSASLLKCVGAVSAGQVAPCKAIPLISGMCNSMESLLTMAGSGREDGGTAASSSREMNW